MLGDPLAWAHLFSLLITSAKFGSMSESYLPFWSTYRPAGKWYPAKSDVLNPMVS